MNFPELTSVSTPVPDIRHCGWAGGPDGEGGPPEVGAEDDPPLPRGGGVRLHAVMEGRTRVRRDHTQVTRQRKIENIQVFEFEGMWDMCTYFKKQSCLY